MKIELMSILDSMCDPHEIVIEVFTEAVTSSFESKVYLYMEISCKAGE